MLRTGITDAERVLDRQIMMPWSQLSDPQNDPYSSWKAHCPRLCCFAKAKWSKCWEVSSHLILVLHGNMAGIHSSRTSANTRRWPNAGLMFTHRLRGWPNFNPALGQRLVFPGAGPGGHPIPIPKSMRKRHWSARPVVHRIAALWHSGLVRSMTHIT